MSNLEVLTGRNYLSHSSLSTYIGCGERFRLERVVQVPQTKAWYLIGGSAFHLASELLDTGRATDPEQAWADAWAEQYERDILHDNIDPATVRAGGRSSKEWPDKENDKWWVANGPRMVADYLAWRDARFADGWQWFTTPDGQPAVETPIQLDLGDVLVKGFIDRVMVTDAGELLVVDLKTGSHTPASSLQLGIYALGVERHFGVKPILGSYYMARKAELTGPTSLLHYSPDTVGRWFTAAKKGIEAELFIPNVTSMCGSCTVRPYCTAFGAGLADAPSSR